MFLPNYNNGSIVNLMSSITQALGGTLMYAPLAALLPFKARYGGLLINP